MTSQGKCDIHFSTGLGPQPEGVGKAREQFVGASARAELDKLAAEYIATRKRMKPDSERTSEMSAIFTKMVTLASQIEGINIKEQLINNDAGHRLVGYAYLYSKPDNAMLDTLVEAVTEFENQPFGQYWGIKAIGKLLSTTRPIPPNIVTKLRNFLSELNKGTDRHFALSKILDELPKGDTDERTVA